MCFVGYSSGFWRRILKLYCILGLYRFAWRVWTKRVLTALAFKMCMAVNWHKTATKCNFIRYNSTSGLVLGIKEKLIQFEKPTRGSGESYTTGTLVTVSVLPQADRRSADIRAICHHHDEYRGLTANPEPASGAHMDTLFDQNLLLAQAGDLVKLSEESLSATRIIIEKVGCVMPVSKKNVLILTK